MNRFLVTAAALASVFALAACDDQEHVVVEQPVTEQPVEPTVEVVEPGNKPS
jgi:cobalamin biosynthesis protein CbiD